MTIGASATTGDRMSQLNFSSHWARSNDCSPIVSLRHTIHKFGESEASDGPLAVVIVVARGVADERGLVSCESIGLPLSIPKSDLSVSVVEI